ncbi:hypothetical protein GCM10023231_33110 [Olivibacter ginsenosidimutans]|uniref:DUF4974 domain-containing protein n=1 Tax=Olivibacter ginsenosidimutans TaxID=1176537 RepID=A0ABP9BZ15_9SPHI
MYLKKILRFFRRSHRRKNTVDERRIVQYFEQMERGNDFEQVDQHVWTDEQHRRIYRHIQTSVVQKREVIERRQFWLRVAAVGVILLLGVGIGQQIYNRSGTVRQEFVAGVGEVKNITLADGTRIWLNNASKLAYMEDRKERKIQLHGEAYFEIAGNVHKPFSVQSGDMLVEVLGTNFNIRAHRSEPMMLVSVQSGSVAVSTQQSMNHQQERIQLHAQEQLAYHIRERKFGTVKHLATFDVNHWRTGMLHYQAVPLRLIISDLERRFDVHISANQALLDCPITATFDDDPLTKILTILASTIEGDVVYESGIYKLTGKHCN